MTIELRTDDRIDVVDVTERVERELPDVEYGTCTVFVEHTTAALSINEAERRLLEDIEEFAERRATAGSWRHDELDGNADAHLRSSLFGRSVSIPIRGGELALGRWQAILLIECDGPRRRTLSVTATPGVEP